MSGHLLASAEFAVLLDFLMTRGATPEVVERVKAALDPESVVLSRAEVYTWLYARGGGSFLDLVRAHGVAAAFVAVPQADAALIERLRRMAGDLR